MWSHSDLPLNAGKRFNKHYYFLGLELRLQAEVENLKLKLQKQGNTISTLKKQVQISKSRKFKKQLAAEQLRKYFSSSQTKQIMEQKRVCWSEDDIVNGLLLCSLSKRSYSYIRRKKMFPLPAISTLRKWVSKFQCLPGVLDDVLAILKKQMFAETKEHYKLGVFLFDEMEIWQKYDYFKNTDSVFPAHKKVQVGLIRGLCFDWKQPVFFNFDTPMKEDILEDIIKQIESTGIEVWAMTCDSGPTNQSLWKQLGITIGNTSFVNPADPSRKIFVFADVPHLLKLLRNHILDYGIQIDPNNVINQSDFVEILEANQGEFKIHPKLTEFHINCTGSQRKRVRPAAQLLSHSSATAMRCLNNEKTVQANFVDLINNW